jgi:tetratricopeptide (TPR) repeat protein
MNSVRLTILLAIAWVPLDLFGQIDLQKYFTGDVIPAIQPAEYQDIEIVWNMPGTTQAFLNTGITELKENNYRIAVTNFNSVLRLDRASEPAFYYRAVAYKSMLNFDSAAIDFTRAFKLNKSWQSAEQLGEIYVLLGDILKADEWFQKASKINPQAVLPHYHLAVLQFKKGYIAEAMTLFDKCHQIDPKFAPAFVMQGLVVQHINNGKLNNSLPYFSSAIAADSTSKLGLFWRGVTYGTMDKPEQGLADFDKLVSLNPGIPFFLLLRGFFNIELYRYDFAFNDFRKAILSTASHEDAFKGGQTLLDKQLDIQYAMSYAVRFSYGLDPDALKHFRKGFCLLLADRKSEALTSFRYAEVLEPSAPVYFMKAVTLEHFGNHTEALSYYTKALKLDNDIFDAHKKRAIYLTELKDYAGALNDFKEMIRLEPNLAQTYRLRGFTRMHQSDFNGAIEDLSRYCKADSMDGEVWANIAYAHEQLQNFSEAGKNYLISARIGKKPEYYSLAFSAFIKTRDTSQLLGAYEIYAKEFPFEADPIHKKARIYIAQRDWKKAKSEVEKALVMTEGSYYGQNFTSISQMLKGLLSLEQKNIKEALTWIIKAKKTDPSNLEADYIYAKALSIQGDVGKAVEIFEQLRTKNYPGAEDEYQMLLEKSKR